MSDWVTYIIYDMHEHKFIKYLLHNKHALMNTCINVLVKHSLYNYLECLLLLTLHHAIKLMNAAKACLTKPDFFYRKDKYMQVTCNPKVWMFRAASTCFIKPVVHTPVGWLVHFVGC